MTFNQRDLYTSGLPPMAALLAMAVDPARDAGYDVHRWQAGDIDTGPGGALVKTRATVTGWCGQAARDDLAARARAAHVTCITWRALWVPQQGPARVPVAEHVTAAGAEVTAEAGAVPPEWLVTLIARDWGDTITLAALLTEFAAGRIPASSAPLDGPLRGARPGARGAGPVLTGGSSSPAARPQDGPAPSGTDPAPGAGHQGRCCPPAHNALGPHDSDCAIWDDGEPS